MINRKVHRNKSFILYNSNTGAGFSSIVASIKDKKADPVETCREIYLQISKIMRDAGIQIFQEKIFGSIYLQKEILKVREDVFRSFGIYEELPLIYIQGEPIWGKGFSGLQILAVKPQDKLWTIYDDKIPCGRGMKKNGTTFLSLQNIHGLKETHSNGNSRAEQVTRMFDRTNTLLSKNGAAYRDVVCTRIYISDILDWYSEFNSVRNKKYTEYGILQANSEDLITEQIYLPSSTGIHADNPDGAEAVMNVLAIVKETDSQLEIKHDNGIKQKSAYRYGSAFSRSVIISEPDNKCILLSGTAAINEQGKSLFPKNPREQIRKTFEIVDALVNKEGVSLRDICQATVFLKRHEDIPVYKEVVNEYGLADIPAVCVIGDVCRDELLFELDAVFFV